MGLRRFLRAAVNIFHSRGCGCTTMASLLAPPVSVRGMTYLDRTAFTTDVEIPCLRLRDVIPSKVMPVVKKYLLKLPKLKPVRTENNDVVVYLDPRIVCHFEDITETDKLQLSHYRFTFNRIKLTLAYENWPAQSVLRAVLPKSVEVPTSYSVVGHIAHLNLRDVHLPYKTIIGQVYLDNVHNVRTVVNKVNTIDTTFRNFTMEILAGDKETVTSLKENGCTFEFDFAQVYWNTRLSTEHEALVSVMRPGDTLYDVFAGVGPFSVLAARRGIRTLANDLNPESYTWLCKNAKLNKAKASLSAYNMDGREFLSTVVRADMLKRRAENAGGQEHIAMNLPDTAIDFLNILPNWFSSDEIKMISRDPPIMHLYCFVKLIAKTVDGCDVAVSMVEEKIGCTLSPDILVNTRNVRNVAPGKDMIRVSFRLTESILKCEEPAMKRAKTEEATDLLLVNYTITGRNGEEQGCPKNEKCIPSGDNA